jgi:hypothetical protein
MRKVLITLIVAFATTSAFAQTVNSFMIDSVVPGANPMTEMRVHVSYSGLSQGAYTRINYGIQPNIYQSETMPSLQSAGTNTFSVLITGLVPDQPYVFTAEIFLATGPQYSNAFAIATSACNFVAGLVNTGNDTICQGQSVDLIASPAGASSYTWSRNGLILTETSNMLTVNQSGTYMVSVNDGCVATAQTAITVVNPVATITNSGNLAFCAGDSITLTASNGDSYSWNNGASTQTITVNSAGTYNVTVTTATCSATSSDVVTSTTAVPTVIVTPGGSTTFCQGGSVTLNATGGTNYLWSNGSTSQSISVSTAGTYSATASNGGCSATSSDIVVTVNPAPTATISANGSTTFCVGGQVELTASNGDSYLWSNGVTTQTVTASVAGDYSVIVTSNGCSTTSNPVSVSTLTAGAVVTAGGPTTFCQGGSVTLYSSSNFGNQWSSGDTTQAITVTQSGTYNVMVSNGVCQGTSNPMPVTVEPLPSAPTVTASGSTTFCQGGSVLLSTSGGSTYTWNNGEASQSILVTQTGNYSVSMTDTTGCQSPQSQVVTVMVNPMPTPQISYVGSTTFCEGGSVILSAMGAGAYSWNTGENTQAITASASGNYTVTVTNQYDCVASASQSVTVNPLPTPTVTANGSTTFCEGGSVTLMASGSGNFTWNTGHIGSSLTVFAEGTYNVTAVDATGCEGISNNLMIWVNPNPEVGIMQAGPNSSSITANVFGGTAPYEYLWSTGDVTPSILVFQNGPYEVTVTDANGCSGSNLTSVVGVGIEEILEALALDIDHINAHDISGRKVQEIRTRNQWENMASGLYILRGYDRTGNLLLTEKVYR